jgi:hypothetical protein
MPMPRKWITTTTLLLSVGGSVAAAAPAPDPVAARRRAPLRGGLVAPAPGQALDVDTLLAALAADAAQVAGVGADRVKLLLQEPVTWPDGSLGCPQPGRMVTQALVSGWRIQFEADGRVHEYHASQRGRWLECAPGALAPAGAASADR